jgi:hypothetical protein
MNHSLLPFLGVYLKWCSHVLYFIGSLLAASKVVGGSASTRHLTELNAASCHLDISYLLHDRRESADNFLIVIVKELGIGVPLIE